MRTKIKRLVRIHVSEKFQKIFWHGLLRCSLRRLALPYSFPSANATIATPIINIIIAPTVGSDEINCCDCEIGGGGLGEVLGVGVGVGVAIGDGVDIGVGLELVSARLG